VGVIARTASRSVLWLLIAVGSALSVANLSAAPIPVKYKEGTLHGFLVLRSQDGQQLATGELLQTVAGDRVTSDVVFHFSDGSSHEEITVFSQRTLFHLLTYHLRQQGPSFPKPIDAYMEVASGNMTIRTDDHGKVKSEVHHLKIPPDVANGMFFDLLKDISPSGETTLSMVTTSAKPRVVKLKIHAAGDQEFSASGHPFKAIDYVIHIDLGAVTGAVASAIGKQPDDLHVWMVGGKAPTLVKFSGQFYEGGPVWSTEMADVK